MFTCICVGNFDRGSSYLIPPHPILVVGGKTIHKLNAGVMNDTEADDDDGFGNDFGEGEDL